MIQQALIFDFSLGELSPKLRGRFDLPIYQHGASLIRNAIPAPQGGFTMRNGTVFLATAAAKVRLIPFVVTPSLAYVLEIGHIAGQANGFLNVWKNGARTAVTFATPWTGTAPSEIHYAQNETQVIFTHRNALIQVLTMTATDTFTFGALPISGNAGEIPFQHTNNYPATCAFHDGRLWAASTETKPGGIWASVPFEYGNFTFFDTVSTTVKVLKDPATWADPMVPEYEDVTTTRDIITSANAIEMEIDDTVQWLASARDLVVGAVRGERVIPAGSVPPMVQCIRNTAIGTAKLQPPMVGGAIMMVEADRMAVREYQYQDQTGSYHAPALSFTADHILTGKVADLDYQNNPVPILWTLLDTGELIGCVYEKAQGVTAWFRVQAGTVESVAIVPESEADVVYLAVNRGGTRCIEKMTGTVKLDSQVGKTVSSGAVTGITWISGAAALWYNGAQYDITIAAGSATVPNGIPDGANVTVGLPITMTVTSMPLPAQSKIGTAHMRLKSPARVMARVLECYPFEASGPGSQYETANLTGPYSGDVVVPIRSQWGTEGEITIRQAGGRQTTILALQVELDAGG